MEKNSSTYNNKRFAQRTDNYGDYERNPSIPAPASGQGFLGLGNTNQLSYLGFAKTSPFLRGEFYSDSISNAKAFDQSSIYSIDPKFKEEISKFISYIKMLNDGKDSESDGPKNSWLGKNRKPKDQYDEFTNWSQSERQKYSDRFEAMKGTKRGAILQKALVALKNAEIAAAKFSFPNDPGTKAATYMSDAKESDKPSDKPSNKPSDKPSDKPSAESDTGILSGEQKPQKTYEKFNYSYIPFIKKIKTENDLLFFAMMKALNIKISEYNKDNESSYYTKDNYSKIQSELNKIADSEYLNKINPALSSLKQKALDKLFDKVGGIDVKPNSGSSASNPGAGTAGPMITTTGPDGEQKVESPVQTEAGNEIRRLLDTAKGLDNNQLKRLWKNMLDRINVLMRNPQIDDLEKVEFEQKIKDILLRYDLAFYPEGGQQLASGAFVVNTPEALRRILLQALRVKDVEAANKAVDQLKILFDNNPEYNDYQQIRAELKQRINQYNFDADEMVNNF